MSLEQATALAVEFLKRRYDLTDDGADIPEGAFQIAMTLAFRSSRLKGADASTRMKLMAAFDDTMRAAGL